MTNLSTEKKTELKIIRRPSGVALITFDSSAKYNALGAQVRMELEQSLELLENDDSVIGVICCSGKSDNFIIGADLQEIRKCESKELIYQLSKVGQALLDKMVSYTKPILAAIHGSCLGGGLELALACHGRVASNDKLTIFALPETRLGLIPGLGGTQRLPALIGLKPALDMILSATPISAEQALEYGVIDKLVDRSEIVDEAEREVLSWVESGDWKAQWIEQTRKYAAGVSTDAEADKPTVFRASRHCKVVLEPEKAQKLLAVSERAIKLRTKGNYPAQTEVIGVIREGLQNGMTKGLEREARVFSDLAYGDVAANLISLFFNTDFAKASAQSLVQKFNNSKIKTLGLIGAGVMGTGLAELAARGGINVILKTNPEKMEKVNEDLRQFAQRSAHQLVSNKQGDEREKVQNEILDRIKLVSTEKDLAEADLILECIIEDQEVKQQLLMRLSAADGPLNDSAILATGTSSFSVGELSKSVAKPENFIGLHFFNPVAMMPLVELISHAGTAKQTLAGAMDLVLKLDKTPIVVKDTPGFLINRLLTIYLFELARLAEEGKPLNWVEETMLEFGMPIGPLQLMDEIGIDVSFTVATTLEAGFGERMRSPQIFHRSAAMGLQGKRSNVGFYLWENSEKRLGINQNFLETTGAVFNEEKASPEEKVKLTERLLFPMIDEAARCLQEKVVSRPREIDFALILGTGFPAFRGGLLRYADTRKLRYIVSRLEEIYSESESCGSSGKREVSELLKKYATEGRGFYSLAGAKEE